MLLNGLLVLGGTKFSKPIEEISVEELNVFLKSFCTYARKKNGTLSVYAFTEANKALEHL